jgi:hypothetical protein
LGFPGVVWIGPNNLQGLFLLGGSIIYCGAAARVNSLPALQKSFSPSRIYSPLSKALPALRPARNGKPM